MDLAENWNEMHKNDQCRILNRLKFYGGLEPVNSNES
jgi:hypothetical protein